MKYDKNKVQLESIKQMERIAAWRAEGLSQTEALNSVIALRLTSIALTLTCLDVLCLGSLNLIIVRPTEVCVQEFDDLKCTV